MEAKVAGDTAPFLEIQMTKATHSLLLCFFFLLVNDTTVHQFPAIETDTYPKPPNTSTPIPNQLPVL